MRYIVGFLVALAMLIPAPANAHTLEATQGADSVYVKQGYNCDPPPGGSCTQYHRKVIVNDRECDGNSVYADVRFRNGESDTLNDFGGCDSNAAEATAPPGYNVDRFRACEMQPGADICGDWVNVNNHEVISA